MIPQFAWSLFHPLVPILASRLCLINEFVLSYSFESSSSSTVDVWSIALRCCLVPGLHPSPRGSVLRPQSGVAAAVRTWALVSGVPALLLALTRSGEKQGSGGIKVH